MLSVSNLGTGVATIDSPRRGRLFRVLAASLLCVVLLRPAFGQPAMTAEQAAAEQHKIDYLITSVATMKGASFIRNGMSYDATRAAEHMRLKLRFAGSQVKTAEEFIACCATGSSVSGVNYTIRFADGHIVDSATFLRGKLAAYKPGMTGAAD